MTVGFGSLMAGNTEPSCPQKVNLHSCWLSCSSSCGLRLFPLSQTFLTLVFIFSASIRQSTPSLQMEFLFNHNSSRLLFCRINLARAHAPALPTPLSTRLNHISVLLFVSASANTSAPLSPTLLPHNPRNCKDWL